MISTRRRCLVLVALSLALASCGASATEVRTARSARYTAEPTAVLVAITQSVEASRYHVGTVADRVVTTKPRYFRHDGTSLRAPEPDESENGIPVLQGAEDVYKVWFRIVANDDDGARTVAVESFVELRRPKLVPLMLGPTDRSRPPFIAGQVDALYVRIYDRLRPSAIAAAP